MYIKRGTFFELNGTENPLLKTPEGASYEVSFVSAFIWDLLDGQRSINQVAKEIEETGKLENKELPEIVAKVIEELEKVGLVKKA